MFGRRGSALVNSEAPHGYSFAKSLNCVASRPASPGYDPSETTYPWIDYVYLWRQDQPLNRADSEADDLQASALARGLLMNSSLPEGFELIGETAFEWPDRKRVVFARAFHISN